MTLVKPVSLGDFLAREHHLQSSIISTTSATFLSELDANYDCDEWCLVGNDETPNGTIDQLSQRVNSLENITRQLVSRIHQLESNNQKQCRSIPSAAIRSTPQNKAIEYPSATQQKPQFRSTCTSFLKLNHAQSLKDALILQKQKILNKNRNKPKRKTTKTVIPQTHKSLFQKELAFRVQNPKLKEAWHILKARTVEDPHAAALMSLRREMMNAKSHLRRVVAPNCKTVIILD